MPRRSWLLRIEDTLQAVERIRSYVESLDYETFSNDNLTIDAVLRNLEIIGEASHHIPEEIRRENVTLPWQEMRAMRNYLSHGYFLVDNSIIWKTVQEDLPLLVAPLKKILEENS